MKSKNINILGHKAPEEKTGKPRKGKIALVTAAGDEEAKEEEDYEKWLKG